MLLLDVGRVLNCKIVFYSGVQMSKWTPAKNGDFILCCTYAPWLRSGRNVTAENVFTYIPLVDDLLTDGLTYVGALRSNKPHLPDAMKTSNNCEVHNSLFGFNDQMTLVSYVPKPNKYVVALPACIMMQVLQTKCTSRRLSCITMPPRVEWTTSTTYPLCTPPGER